MLSPKSITRLWITGKWLILWGLSAQLSALGSPLSDISSPDQATRDAAAAILRKTYVPLTLDHYDALMAALQPGTPKSKVLQLLEPYHPQVLPFGRSDAFGDHAQFYYLDQCWFLECLFLRKDDTLISRSLTPKMQYRWIVPPPRFTGVWVVYSINGQKARECHLQNGLLTGENLAFDQNGRLERYEWYDTQGHPVESADYFPNGVRKSYGQYQQGREVGIWMTYHEDGTVATTTDHSLPGP